MPLLYLKPTAEALTQKAGWVYQYKLYTDLQIGPVQEQPFYQVCWQSAAINSRLIRAR